MADGSSREIWKDIPGYEGSYQASDAGRVRSLDRTLVRPGPGGRPCTKRYRGRVLRPGSNRLGYQNVKLPSGVTRAVHRLVLETFVGERPESLYVCHNNGDPTDNRLSNLRYDTPSGNNYDQVKHGTHPSRNRTHCPYDHRLAAPNLGYAKEPGYRTCLACQRAHKCQQGAKEAGRSIDLRAVADEKYAEIMSGERPAGVWPSGGVHYGALGLDKVERILAGLAEGCTIRQLAAETGTERWTIGEIKAGRHWSCQLGGRFYRAERRRGVGAKLTMEQAQEIRRRRASGERGVDLAREFNVSTATISLVNTGKTWNPAIVRPRP